MGVGDRREHNVDVAPCRGDGGWTEALLVGSIVLTRLVERGGQPRKIQVLRGEWRNTDTFDLGVASEIGLIYRPSTGVLTTFTGIVLVGSFAPVRSIK